MRYSKICSHSFSQGLRDKANQAALNLAFKKANPREDQIGITRGAVGPDAKQGFIFIMTCTVYCFIQNRPRIIEVFCKFAQDSSWLYVSLILQ